MTAMTAENGRQRKLIGADRQMSQRAAGAVERMQMLVHGVELAAAVELSTKRLALSATNDGMLPLGTQAASG